MSGGDLLVTDSPQVAANEYLMARDAAEVLHAHYPGWLWGVNINGSVMDIRCLDVSGAYGYTLHIPAIYSASEFKKNVMRAGGEILERYRQRTGALDPQRLSDAKRDFRGALVFDR